MLNTAGKLGTSTISPLTCLWDGLVRCRPASVLRRDYGRNYEVSRTYADECFI